VVTPGHSELAAREEFDGVEVVRFPMNLPEDLSYGKVAQSKVSAWGKLSRLAVMAAYIRGQRASAIEEGRDFSASIVHGHWAIPTGPAIISTAKRLGIPSVITMHGGDVYVNVSQGYNFPTRWYVRPVLKWTLQSANCLTAISDDCRVHALNAGADDSNIRIIMNGADLQRFCPGSVVDDDAKRYGSRMIFACRQLFPRKGIRFLLRAVAMLRADFPDIRVVIAGDGFERAGLEKLAKDLEIDDCTEFLGWVPNADLPRFYRAATVSVIPSLEEGFGIPAAEAMGCELPVVASDAGGLPEVVDDGVTGYVVPKGDAEAIAHALRTLLEDPDLARKMGVAGRRRALERFSWELTAKEIEAVYESLEPKES
jgi:glycosyltransferase involved in cell wall biosynthesis